MDGRTVTEKDNRQPRMRGRRVCGSNDRRTLGRRVQDQKEEHEATGRSVATAEIGNGRKAATPAVGHEKLQRAGRPNNMDRATCMKSQWTPRGWHTDAIEMLGEERKSTVYTQAVVRIATNQPELAESNVSGTRFETPSLLPRSRRQWRCRRKPNAANVWRSCRSEGLKETSRTKSTRREESSKIAIVLNNSHQFKIPEHMLNRNRSTQDITEVHDVTST